MRTDLWMAARRTYRIVFFRKELFSSGPLFPTFLTKFMVALQCYFFPSLLITNGTFESHTNNTLNLKYCLFSFYFFPYWEIRNSKTSTFEFIHFRKHNFVRHIFKSEIFQNFKTLVPKGPIKRYTPHPCQ